MAVGSFSDVMRDVTRDVTWRSCINTARQSVHPTTDRAPDWCLLTYLLTYPIHRQNYYAQKRFPITFRCCAGSIKISSNLLLTELQNNATFRAVLDRATFYADHAVYGKQLSTVREAEWLNREWDEGTMSGWYRAWDRERERERAVLRMTRRPLVD